MMHTFLIYKQLIVLWILCFQTKPLSRQNYFYCNGMQGREVSASAFISHHQTHINFDHFPVIDDFSSCYFLIPIIFRNLKPEVVEYRNGGCQCRFQIFQHHSRLVFYTWDCLFISLFLFLIKKSFICLMTFVETVYGLFGF